MKIIFKKTRAELESRRVQAAKQMSAGVSPTSIANFLGVSVRNILLWKLKFSEGGEEALKAKRGKGPAKLSPEQQRGLRDYIQMNPADLGLGFQSALWTRKMVRALILEKFGVSYTLHSVGKLLRRLRYSPQRPQYIAQERDPEKVRLWETEEYPAILVAAKASNALIFFADESGLRTDHHAGRTWAPVGRTPKLIVTGKRESIGMLSAVATTGEFSFMTVERTVNGSVFIEFLRRLMAGTERNVHLIVDGVRYHTCNAVKETVESFGGRLTLHFLPPYSPQLNPDEQVWAVVKGEVGRLRILSKEMLREGIKAAFNRLAALPELVRGMFRHPDCFYASTG